MSNLDTGAAQRVLRNLSAAFAVAKFFGLNDAVDVGGGDGLLCRFLRDYGINCFIRDKYAKPAYAQAFTNPDFDAPELIFGFEVLEHLHRPQTDLDSLFGTGASVVLVSTCIYSNQGNDWWYLAPEGGQHVFFYSEEALQMIAQRYGCEIVISNDMILFAKRGLLGTLRSIGVKVLLNRYASRVLRSMIVFLPTPGALRDHMRLKTLSRK